MTSGGETRTGAFGDVGDGALTSVGRRTSDEAWELPEVEGMRGTTGVVTAEGCERGGEDGSSALPALIAGLSARTVSMIPVPAHTQGTPPHHRPSLSRQPPPSVGTDAVRVPNRFVSVAMTVVAVHYVSLWRHRG